jgi:hypothetical protein
MHSSQAESLKEIGFTSLCDEASRFINLLGYSLESLPLIMLGIAYTFKSAFILA